jgi:uncharacterized protein YhaN
MHRKKELLTQKESELKERQALMKEQIEEFLVEHTQLRHLVENTQAINSELHYAEEQVEKLDLKQNQLLEEIQQKKIELASISDYGGINLMHVYEDVQFLKEKIQRLTDEKEMLQMVLGGYLSVRKDYNSTFCDILTELINKQLQEISKSDRIKISLQEDLRLRVWEMDKTVIPEHLNENMRMLLSLTARFALLNYLTQEISLPVFLDDPFNSFDSEKRSGIEHVLKQMSKTHQIILLTIDDHYKNWGDVDDSLA